MKKIIFFLTIVVALSTLCSAQKNINKGNPVLNAYFGAVNDMSLEEGQQYFLELYQMLLPTVDSLADNFYADSDEHVDYEHKKSIDWLPWRENSHFFSPNNLRENIVIGHGLPSNLQDPDNPIEIEGNIDSLSSVLVITNFIDNYYVRYKYNIDTIYYKDGSSLKIDSTINNYLLLHDLKLIDSVSLTITCPEELTERIISNKQKEAHFRDATIKLKYIDRNTAQFEITGDAANAYKVSAIKTKQGDFADWYNEKLSTIQEDAVDQLKSEMEKHFSKIVNKIKKNKYKSKKEFVSDIEKQCQKIEYVMNTESYRELTVKYKGDIEEVYVFFRKDEPQKIQITLPVNETLHQHNNIEFDRSYLNGY